MVAMIVGNEQSTLREVAMCQPLHFQRSRLMATLQLLAVIYEQPSALALIFCHAATDLMCATMNGDVHFID